MIKFALISTKGGVGKTTLTANFSALLAEMGLRVLMVDADVQPSLSKWYPLDHRAAFGLTRVITRGEVKPEDISHTRLNKLDIIVSDDPEGGLPHWLLTRIDRGMRLRQALNSPIVSENYDCVFIDTQGTVGPLQEAAALAADILISPIPPEILSAREFKAGTLELLTRLAPSSAMGISLAPLKAIIYRQDRTNDAHEIARSIREDFITKGECVTVLDTVVPYAKAYKEAATRRMPVHRHEATRSGAGPSASQVMHRLVWELIPSLSGQCVDTEITLRGKALWASVRRLR